MSPGLISVRLDSERLRRAQKLRESGISLSDLVREAIDERFRRLRSKPPADAKSLIGRIFEQYPDPTNLPRRDYNVHDRKAAREAALRKPRTF